MIQGQRKKVRVKVNLKRRIETLYALRSRGSLAIVASESQEKD